MLPQQLFALQHEWAVCDKHFTPPRLDSMQGLSQIMRSICALKSSLLDWWELFRVASARVEDAEKEPRNPQEYP